MKSRPLNLPTLLKILKCKIKKLLRKLFKMRKLMKLKLIAKFLLKSLIKPLNMSLVLICRAKFWILNDTLSFSKLCTSYPNQNLMMMRMLIISHFCKKPKTFGKLLSMRISQTLWIQKLLLVTYWKFQELNLLEMSFCLSKNMSQKFLKTSRD